MQVGVALPVAIGRQLQQDFAMRVIWEDATRRDALAPSESSLDLAAQVRFWPEADARDLMRILKMRIVLPTRVQANRDLRLYIEMVREWASLPLAEAYDSCHAAAAALGWHSPSRSTLCERYGDWGRVGDVALRILESGSDARIRKSLAYTRGSSAVRPGTYNPTPHESDAMVEARRSARRDRCAAVLLRCWDYYGYEAGEREYLVWRRVERQAARLFGRAVPLLPSRRPLTRGFDGEWRWLAAYTRLHAPRLRATQPVLGGGA